jgi:putative nucleotidyltransferase with HDIG domain
VETADSLSSSLATSEDEIAVRFIAIPLESLRLDTVTNFNIHIRTTDEQQPVLYRAENLPFTDKVRARLLEHDIEHIYIERKDRENYQKYLEDNLDKIVADDAIVPEKKAEIVYSSAVHLMEQLFENPWLGDNIRRGEKLVVNTVDLILRDDRAFRGLLAVTSYDYYTYTHSVNVCVFCVALAQRVGLCDKADLQILGTGALLHDVGKSIIDKNIIAKKGPLNEEEWAIIKKHPIYGVEVLRKSSTIPEESYSIVNQHHERLDGSGYPEGLNKNTIHIYAKIAAIADVFDAMTTQRVYKDAVGSFTALNIMKTEMQDGIDEGLFREFVLLMGT